MNISKCFNLIKHDNYSHIYHKTHDLVITFDEHNHFESFDNPININTGWDAILDIRNIDYDKILATINNDIKYNYEDLCGRYDLSYDGNYMFVDALIIHEIVTRLLYSLTYEYNIYDYVYY